MISVIYSMFVYVYATLDASSISCITCSRNLTNQIAPSRIHASASGIMINRQSLSLSRPTSVAQPNITTPAPAIGPGITLFTAATPNGCKVSIALEELKAIGAIPSFVPSPCRPTAPRDSVSYSFVSISFDKNEQKSDWFLKVRGVVRGGAVAELPSLCRSIQMVTANRAEWERSAYFSIFLGRIPALVDTIEG
jgi:hypothetical protein